jgi:cytochrome b subunit of formate dehydrogenase
VKGSRHTLISFWVGLVVAFLFVPRPLVAVQNPVKLATKSPGADQSCLDCHSDKDIKPVTDRGKTLKLAVEPNDLVGSVHEQLSCSDCHGGATTFEDAPHNEGKPLTLRCTECHEQADKEYLAGVHGKAHARGAVTNAPFCNDCHGGHKIVPLQSKDSILSPTAQPQTCGKCHSSDVLVPDEGITKRRLIDRYYSSVHWQGIKEGKPAATCADCHGRHTVLGSGDLNSNVSRIGILSTCGKCHGDITQIFSEGSHGRALLHGNLDVPTCTTCHGDHDVMSLRAQSGQKRNFAGTEICIWCHGNERMMARYALDTSPVESYMRDFHGLTQRGTAGTSATCADCHDAHHSLPSSHPQSRMHLSNRGTACGKCHGQTTESFIMSFTHKTKSVDQGGDIRQIIVIIYLILIFSVIGGMLAHNLVIWSHSLRRKYHYQKQHPTIVRLDRFEQFWHWILLISFFLLAFTGFALKYPESIFFSWLYSLGMTEGARAFIHRLAAATLLADFMAFFVYQAASRRGKRWLIPMLPRRSDVTDFFATMKYYLGWVKERPRYAVFNYAEKAEYWALIWGTVIMALTGFVLWFPKSLPSTWPSWLIEISRTIHFYEATLATLAIVVWHFFHTIFRYEEYPMDTSWLTGVLTEDEARHRFTDEAIAAQLPTPPKPPPDLGLPEKPVWTRDQNPDAPSGQLTDEPPKATN